MFFLSTAKRCSYMTSIQRFPSQSHPLIGSSVQNHSMVMWNRPRQINLDQGRPRQTMADHGRPRQTKADHSPCRGLQGVQVDAVGMQGDAAKPAAATMADQGRPRQTKPLWYVRCYQHLWCISKICNPSLQKSITWKKTSNVLDWCF